MKESVDVRLARIEESMSATRGEIRNYHAEVRAALPLIQKNHDAIAVLKRDRFWVSGLGAVALSWLGLKLFGKG